LAYTGFIHRIHPISPTPPFKVHSNDDVIIGNATNVIDDVEADELHTHTDQAGQEGHAVITRAQAKL